MFSELIAEERLVRSFVGMFTFDCPFLFFLRHVHVTRTITITRMSIPITPTSGPTIAPSWSVVGGTVSVKPIIAGVLLIALLVSCSYTVIRDCISKNGSEHTLITIVIALLLAYVLMHTMGCG